ncbi:MAG: hypothetical protein AAF799_45300 [Myxococcota bacterium]
MTRAWPLVLSLGGLLTACAGGSETDTTTANLAGSSTGEPTPSESTTGEPTPAPTPMEDTTTTDPGPVDSSDDGGTTTEADSGSSDEGCTPGTLDCGCDDGMTCAGELLCLGGVCQDAQCGGDIHEPNDDEGNAVYLGEIDDSDDSGGVFSGSLHHDGDVDWFRYQGDDDFTGNVDPARQLVSSGAVRLCKFLECDNGISETEFECPPGTSYALSPMARPGCCATGDVELPDLNCAGVSEDNAMVYIRVDQPEDTCVTYSVAYHY